jgi:CheY-like chemotaxis protein
MTARKPIIYFVEDDADDRALLRKVFLSIPGCTLTFFASSEQFCRHLQSLCPNDPLPTLFVLDFNMPGINGGELLLRVKRQPLLQHIPVAVYSTRMLPILEEMLRANGAQHCFMKCADLPSMETMGWQLYQMAATQTVAH